MKIEDHPDYAVVNELFPRIASKLSLFWGYPEFPKLMLELQQDSSDRPRAGFPMKVLLALQSLEEAHDLEFPQYKRDVPSFWQGLR